MDIYSVARSSSLFVWSLVEKRLLHEILIPSFQKRVIAQVDFVGSTTVRYSYCFSIGDSLNASIDCGSTFKCRGVNIYGCRGGEDARPFQGQAFSNAPFNVYMEALSLNYNLVPIILTLTGWLCDFFSLNGY
jgi:hypothetical protein